MAKTLLDVHRTRNRGARSGPAVTVDAGRDQLRLHDLEFSTSVIGVRASHAGARARPSVFPIRYNAAHHAGAPALAMVTIYHSPTLYRLTTRIGYGPDYAARYTLIADVIRAPGDMLELCCGDLALHRHLEARGLLKSYIGLEHSGAMLKLARRHGVDVRAFDVRSGDPVPTADTVIMQASLYQFHDIADTLLPRLYAAARRLLVIAEPVRNLSQSRRRSVRWLARALTRTADGRVHVFRYTEGTLLALYDHCKIPVSRLDRTPSRYELVVSSLKAPSATADVEARRRSVTDSHTGVGRSPR